MTNFYFFRSFEKENGIGGGGGGGTNWNSSQHWKIFQPIYPEFCDFYWSGFLWLVLFRISVNLLIQTDFWDFYSSRFLNFVDPDFCDIYWSGFVELLLIKTIEIFYCSSSYLTETKLEWYFLVLKSLWAYSPYLCVYEKYTHQYA